MGATRAALVALCTALVLGCATRPLEDRPRVRTLLVTGFGPFPGVAVNPSIEAARPLHGEVIGGLRVVVEQLDVVYARAPEQLARAIERHRPDLVLSLGVAGDPAMRLESTARNRDTAPVPDAAGEVRRDVPVRAGGPDTIPTRLPLDRMRTALRAEGFEVIDSDDAGGYLCNHLFYELLSQHAKGPAGFVHVPPLSATWDLARLTRALRVVVATLGEP